MSRGFGNLTTRPSPSVCCLSLVQRGRELTFFKINGDDDELIMTTFWLQNAKYPTWLYCSLFFLICSYTMKRSLIYWTRLGTLQRRRELFKFFQIMMFGYGTYFLFCLLGVIGNCICQACVVMWLWKC